jgi:twitching motility protein PilI
MASRDTLQAFQARLAERLQAAQTQKVAAAWLAVESGSVGYLLPLADTGEIFPWTAPQAVPHTAPWFLGVANLRGGLHGVARLDAFARAAASAGLSNASDTSELSRTQDDAAPEASSRRLVALHARFEVNCALLVDRVLGLRAADAFQVSSAASGTPAPDWIARTHVDPQGRAWQALDLQALARHPRFLNVGA